MALMADRISKLPDDVLLLILSFLPAEDVIATSLVSKRWRPLWLSVSTLDFDQERYEQQREKQTCFFADFVCATIQARGSHQPIKGFRLLTSRDYEPRVKRWLSKAIQRGVENVEVDCYCPLNLPSNIFSCTTLVALKLRRGSFANYKNGLPSVYLPSLKTLLLTNVLFSKPKDYMEFLYGCPILEILEADNVYTNHGSFQGKFKSLPKLVRAKVCGIREGSHIPMMVFSNVKFLSLNQCRENIPMFPNLNHVKLDWGRCDQLEWNSVLDILKNSPNLQIFVLKLPYYFCKDWPNPQFVPECFSSQLTKCVINICSSMGNHIAFAKYVMQNSTSLRTMTVIWHRAYPCRNGRRKKELACKKELAACLRTCKLLFK